MDDVTTTGSSNSSTDTPVSTQAATEAARPFASKPRRLARGLNDLFARQPGPVVVQPAAKPLPAFVEERQEREERVEQQEPAAAIRQTDADEEPAANAPARAAQPVDPAEEAVAALAQAKAATAAPLQVDASPAPTGYEYRFVQLVSRLDATCNLFADARQTHLVAAQRNSRIAWGVAAGLAIVTAIALWIAGSRSTYNKAQLDYEQTRSQLIEKNLRELTEQNAVISAANESLSRQQAKLAGQYEDATQQATQTQSEIEAIRRALSKANAVIDELMARPVEPVSPQ